MTAGQNCEFTGLQFEHNGPRDSRFFARCGPDPLRQAQDDGVGFG